MFREYIINLKMLSYNEIFIKRKKIINNWSPVFDSIEYLREIFLYWIHNIVFLMNFIILLLFNFLSIDIRKNSHAIERSSSMFFRDFFTDGVL